MAPSRSSFSPVEVTESSAGTSRIAPTATTIPIGTLMKKIHSQPNAVVMMPPSSTPKATPALPIAPQTASATVRCAPEYVVVMIAKADGSRSAAPNPCAARETISAWDDQASPLASEAAVKTSSPTRNTRRRPSRSADRPPSNIRPPVKST